MCHKPGKKFYNPEGTRESRKAIQQLLEEPTIDLMLRPVNYKQLRKRFKDLLINDASTPESLKEEFLSGKKVLLFQNEEIDRTIAEVMLKKLGCSVTTFLTSDDAMKELESSAFDAFITESHIDGIDMKAFIERAKTQNQ